MALIVVEEKKPEAVIIDGVSYSMAGGRLVVERGPGYSVLSSSLADIKNFMVAQAKGEQAPQATQAPQKTIDIGFRNKVARLPDEILASIESLALAGHGPDIIRGWVQKNYKGLLAIPGRNTFMRYIRRINEKTQPPKLAAPVSAPVVAVPSKKQRSFMKVTDLPGNVLAQLNVLIESGCGTNQLHTWLIQNFKAIKLPGIKAVRRFVREWEAKNGRHVNVMTAGKVLATAPQPKSKMKIAQSFLASQNQMKLYRKKDWREKPMPAICVAVLCAEAVGRDKTFGTTRMDQIFDDNKAEPLKESGPGGIKLYSVEIAELVAQCYKDQCDKTKVVRQANGVKNIHVLKAYREKKNLEALAKISTPSTLSPQAHA